MAADDLRPRWVGPASAIFSLAVLALLAGVLYLGFRWALEDTGPTPEQVFFGETLPHWWIAKAKGEAPEVDLWSSLPDPALRAPLRRIETLLDEPAAAAAEAVALNQVIEQAGLPFWIDVVVRANRPVILTFEVEAKDRWRIGQSEEDVLRVTRLDRTNVTTAFSGRKGRGLPVVLLDVIERSVLRELGEDAPDGPADRLRARWLEGYVKARAGSGALDEARAELEARDQKLLRMERRMKGGRVRITKPRRFAFPAEWYERMERVTEDGEGPTLLFSGDLEAVRKADEALLEGPSGAALMALRELWAEVGSAHEAHVSLAPELSDDAPLPEPLAAYYDGSNPDIRRGAFIHYLATLGAVRDAEPPACAVLLRALDAVTGRVRYTAWHYGSMAALHALLETDWVDEGLLTAGVEELCESEEEMARERAGFVLARHGVGPGELDARR